MSHLTRSNLFISCLFLVRMNEMEFVFWALIRHIQNFKTKKLKLLRNQETQSISDEPIVRNTYNSSNYTQIKFEIPTLNML